MKQSNLDFPNLPVKLTSTCRGLIESHSKTHGFNVPSQLWQRGKRETLVFIMTHNDLRDLLGGASACFKIRRMVWIAASLIIASSYFSIYSLFGLVPVVLVERYFARSEWGVYIVMASIVLALEMLATNLGGLGDLYPDARDEAISAFSDLSPGVRTTLLDTYLPNWDALDTEVLRTLFAAQKSN